MPQANGIPRKGAEKSCIGFTAGCTRSAGRVEAERHMQRSRNKTAATAAIEGLFESGTLTSLSNEELLLRFRVQGDARAIEALVERHGPLVVSVCREILADPNDVDDAF